MDKLVDAELRGQIAISPEDVAGYYDQHYRGKAAGADSDEKFQRLKETIVADLQRQKIEDAYSAWVARLKKNIRWTSTGRRGAGWRGLNRALHPATAREAERPRFV